VDVTPAAHGFGLWSKSARKGRVWLGINQRCMANEKSKLRVLYDFEWPIRGRVYSAEW
jgi:hypothetical protein